MLIRSLSEKCLTINSCWSVVKSVKNSPVYSVETALKMYIKIVTSSTSSSDSAISIVGIVSKISLSSVLFLFLIVGPIEELCKYSVVKRFIFHTEHFDERIDGVVYMVVAAMGFAGFENIMYIINSPNPTLVGIIRCVTSTPGHAIFSGFFGIFLGNAYICRKNQEYGKAWGQIILGFLIALTLHAIYDLFAFSQNTAIVLGGIAGFVIFFGILLIVIVNKLAHESKLELEQSKSKE